MSCHSEKLSVNKETFWHVEKSRPPGEPCYSLCKWRRIRAFGNIHGVPLVRFAAYLEVLLIWTSIAGYAARPSLKVIFFTILIQWWLTHIWPWFQLYFTSIADYLPNRGTKFELIDWLLYCRLLIDDSCYNYIGFLKKSFRQTDQVMSQLH